MQIWLRQVLRLVWLRVLRLQLLLEAELLIVTLLLIEVIAGFIRLHLI